MATKKILVIGGCGYIGGCLTDKLAENGYDVTVFDNLTYENYFLKEVSFEFGDIRNTERLLSLHEKYDELIWLAALVGDGACAQDPDLTFEVNLHCLKRFLDATKRRVIFPSTCSVYGAQEGLLDENSPTNPLSVYAETKLQAEKEILKHGGLAFRLGTLFGMGDTYSRLRLDLVVNVLTLKAIRDGRITVFGGDQWRPILSVRDVADYLVQAVSSDKNDVFNLGRKNVRIKDLVVDLKEVFPEVRIETVDRKFEDLRNYRVSTEKVEQAFSFRPQISVVEEVHRMKKVICENRIKNPSNPMYYNAKFIKSEIETLNSFYVEAQNG